MSIGNEVPDVVEDTYPLHALDDTKTNRNFVNWMMRFNDVLDVKKLNDALSRLLMIGDWKKLGGRLVYKVNQTQRRGRNIGVKPEEQRTDITRLGKWEAESPCPEVITDGPATNCIHHSRGCRDENSRAPGGQSVPRSNRRPVGAAHS